MKTVKFLALLTLGAVAVSMLNACAAKTETSSTGTTAQVQTTTSK